ncbi:MAG: hypothetical protein RMK65_10285, partial [Anaerolineae bacterium]|nr:hypothetical protein [Anaerolineae bacterium]MDW7992491.1 hypothetical protein [Anaerolineae bacterium]
MGTKTLLGVVTALLAALMLTFPPADPDLWWHLRNGKEMVRRGEILTRDVFSYTRFGERWVNVFWLPDLLLYGLYCLGGPFVLALIPPLIGAVIFGLLWGEKPRAPFLRSFLVVVATAAAAPFWALRPQLASYLLLAVLHRWLRQRGGKVWRIPLLFLLWGNIHGGFIWGFLLLLAWGIGGLMERLLKWAEAPSWEELRTLGGITLASALAVLLNPNGLAVWMLPFQTVRVSLDIQEWRSPDFHQISMHPVLWLLFLYIVGLAVAPMEIGPPGPSASVRPSPSPAELLAVLGFAYMGFVSQRALGPFVVVVTPYVLDRLSGLTGVLGGGGGGGGRGRPGTSPTGGGGGAPRARGGAGRGRRQPPRPPRAAGARPPPPSHAAQDGGPR